MDTPQTDEGLATFSSGDTIEQQNFGKFETAFDEGLAKATAELQAEDAGKETAAKPAEAKTETPKEEPEFPSELMTGEKPEEKPKEAEHDDLDDIQPSPKMGEAQQSNFKKLKDIARAARKEAAEIKASLESFKAEAAKKSAPVETDELKAARQRIAEMEEHIERANFTMSPRYAKMQQARDNFIAEAKTYLEGGEISPAVIDAASRVTGAKRVAVLREAGVDPETIGAITANLVSADQMNRSMEDSIKNSKELRSQWEAEEASRAEARKASERAEEDRIFSEVGDAVAKVFEPFQRIEGAEKWNGQADGLRAQAKEFFNGSMSLEDMAEIAYYGVGAKVLHRMFHVQRGELKSLKEQLAKLKAAQPGAGSTNGASKPVQKAGSMTEEELFNQRAASFNQGLGIG